MHNRAFMNKNKVAAREHAGPFKGARRRLSRKANRCYYHYNNICFLAAGEKALASCEIKFVQAGLWQGEGEKYECADSSLRGRGMWADGVNVQQKVLSVNDL